MTKDNAHHEAPLRYLAAHLHRDHGDLRARVVRLRWRRRKPPAPPTPAQPEVQP